jgi:hypothetical protein
MVGGTIILKPCMAAPATEPARIGEHYKKEGMQDDE